MGFIIIIFSLVKLRNWRTFSQKATNLVDITLQKHICPEFSPIFFPKRKNNAKGLFRVKSLYVSLHLLTLLKEKESLHHVRFRIQFWFELGTNLLGSETITMYSKFNILVPNNYSILKISFQKIKIYNLKKKSFTNLFLELFFKFNLFEFSMRNFSKKWYMGDFA